MTWEKGQSGNPKGRPKGVVNKTTQELAKLAREHTEKAIVRLAHIMQYGEASDSLRAIQILFDRGYGKVPDKIQLSVESKAVRYYVDKPPDETMEQWLKRTAEMRGEESEVH